MKLLYWQSYNFIIVVSQPPAQNMSFAKNMFKADGREIWEAFIIFISTCYKGHEPLYSNIAAERLGLPDSYSHNTNPICMHLAAMNTSRDFSWVQKNKDYFINNFWLSKNFLDIHVETE